MTPEERAALIAETETKTQRLEGHELSAKWGARSGPIPEHAVVIGVGWHHPLPTPVAAFIAFARTALPTLAKECARLAEESESRRLLKDVAAQESESRGEEIASLCARNELLTAAVEAARRVAILQPTARAAYAKLYEALVACDKDKTE